MQALFRYSLRPFGCVSAPARPLHSERSEESLHRSYLGSPRPPGRPGVLSIPAFVGMTESFPRGHGARRVQARMVFTQGAKEITQQRETSFPRKRNPEETPAHLTLDCASVLALQKRRPAGWRAASTHSKDRRGARTRRVRRTRPTTRVLCRPVGRFVLKAPRWPSITPSEGTGLPRVWEPGVPPSRPLAWAPGAVSRPIQAMQRKAAAAHRTRGTPAESALGPPTTPTELP